MSRCRRSCRRRWRRFSARGAAKFRRPRGCRRSGSNTTCGADAGGRRSPASGSDPRRRATGSAASCCRGSAAACAPAALARVAAALASLPEGARLLYLFDLAARGHPGLRCELAAEPEILTGWLEEIGAAAQAATLAGLAERWPAGDRPHVSLDFDGGWLPRVGLENSFRGQPPGEERWRGQLEAFAAAGLATGGPGRGPARLAGGAHPQRRPARLAERRRPPPARLAGRLPFPPQGGPSPRRRARAQGLPALPIPRPRNAHLALALRRGDPHLSAPLSLGRER